MGLFGKAKERLGLWWIERWRDRALRGKEGEGPMRFARWLDGNNRIVALSAVLLVGVGQAFGLDVTQYLHLLLQVLHVSPDLPKEMGLPFTVEQVSWAGYAFFSIARALWKRKNGIPEAPVRARG